MGPIQIDRLDGLSSSTAIKGPCRVATTVNVVLAGNQVVDNVALANGERILVKDQTDPRENGIYVVDSGPWRRARDFANNRDIRHGTQVFVVEGDNFGLTSWFVASPNPIVIDQTFLAIEQGSISITQLQDLIEDIEFVGDGSAFPQGRPTLTSGVPAPEADVAGATTIRYEPSVGRYIPVWDGSAPLPRNMGTGLTLSLDADSGHSGYHQSGKVYDLFAFYNNGALRLGTGPAWSTSLLRGTGAGTTELEAFQGLAVNKVAMSVRYGAASGDAVTVQPRFATYLGSFMATGNGQATDSKAKRYLFSAYNQVERIGRIREDAADWTYNSTTTRQANGNAANQVEFLLGLAGTAVSGRLSVFATNSTTSYWGIGIGLDSATTISNDCDEAVAFVPTADNTQLQHAFYDGYPGLGAHRLVWLERGGGSGTQKWFGSTFKSGLNIRFLG